MNLAISPRVGVVTVTYNSAKIIDVFLDSICSQDHEDFILYIIDNASSDDTLQRIRTRNDRRFRAIPQHENTGFAAGCNTGITAATQEGCTHILIINNDTAFPPTLISNLLREQTALSAEIIVPKILMMDPPRTLWAAGGGFNKRRAFASFHFGEGQPDNGQFDLPRPVDFAPGCCMLLTRNALGTVGRFDEQYFVYMEDADYCWRAKRRSVAIWYTPKATLSHRVSSLTGGSGSPFVMRFMTRNRVLFLRKNLSWPLQTFWILVFGAFLCWRRATGQDSADAFRIKKAAYFEGLRLPLEKSPSC
jgi:GT2 family glycosyltransferase